MFYCSIIVVFKIIILVLNMHRYNGLITTDWFWHNGTYIIINGMSYKLNYRCSGLCVQSVSRCSDFGFVSYLFLFARRTSPPIIVQTSFLTHGAYYGQVMDIREYNIVFFFFNLSKHPSYKFKCGLYDSVSFDEVRQLSKVPTFIFDRKWFDLIAFLYQKCSLSEMTCIMLAVRFGFTFFRNVFN